MISQIVRPIDTDTQPLDALYTFHNRADILAFFIKKPKLVPFLEIAQAKISEYFPNSALALQFLPDPEEPIFDCIIIWIAADDDDDTIRNRLLDEWWIHTTNTLGDDWAAVIFEITSPLDVPYEEL